MTDPKAIIAAFERIERERGGYAKAEAKEVLRAVAAELGVTYEEARDVMLSEWTAGGMAG